MARAKDYPLIDVITGIEYIFLSFDGSGDPAANVLPSVLSDFVILNILLQNLAGTVALSQGGTGANDAPTALVNLGALPKAGGTMTGNLILNADPTASLQAVTKNYADNLALGLTWQTVIIDCCLIDDSLNTPPGSPVFGDTYIAGASPTGAWSGKPGYAFNWSGSAWLDILGRAVISGDRFGVAFGTPTFPSGGLTGKINDIATVATNTPGSITYTFYTPVTNDAVSVANAISVNAGNAFRFDGIEWVLFSRSFVPAAGFALSYSGNILNVVPGSLDVNTFTGYPLTVAHGGTGVTTSTGTGNTVLSNSPTLVTPSFPTIVNTGTLTLPTSTDTLIGRATTDTFTNKTYDTAGTGNSLKINGTSITAVTGTGQVVLENSPTISSPVISSIVNTGTLTLPTSTDTLVGRATADTLTNKSISGSANTLTNISLTSSVTGILPVLNGGTGTTTSTGTGSVVLSTSPTLTTPVISSIVNTGTLTLPTSTDTLVGKATTDILTNKTYDTAGTGNVFKINGTTITATTGSGSVVLATSPTLVTPILGVATATTINKLTLTQPATGATLTLADNSTFITSGAFSTTLTMTGTTTVTFPTAGTLATLAGSEILTNKTINGSSNTITNVSLTTGVTGTLPVANGGTGVTTSTGTTNVVLSNSPTLVTPTIGDATATSITNAIGSVSTPSYTFTGNTNTGIYSPTTNQVAITCNGTQVLNVTPTTTYLQSTPVNKVTATTLSGSVTATGAQLFGGIISMTGGGGVTLTLDTAANIYAAMGSPNFVGASFSCFIVSSGGTNTTIATNTGLTLVLGAASVNNDARNYHFVVTNTSTPTITVYGG